MLTIPISVIIVTFNSSPHLSHCLSALSRQTITDFDVIIVDNGSTDGSADVIKVQYSTLSMHIHQLLKNIGFAAANNMGVRMAQGKWVVLLNADAFPEPDWLEKLVEAAEMHPEYAAFSSRQISANATEFLDGAGDAYHISGMAWRNCLGYPAAQYGQESGEVFSPCAAAAMYLRDAFLEVGGFDEDLFSYYEDVDLGFRLRLAGYKAYYVADAVVHHVGSATFGLQSDFAFYHVHRNLVWVFLANMPSPYHVLFLPQHIFLNLFYLFYYALLGRGHVLFRAKRDALASLPKVLNKRRRIQASMNVRATDVVKAMQKDIFEPYFLSFNRRRALKKYHTQS
jgi:GT2 family glycosyltransferase